MTYDHSWAFVSAVMIHPLQDFQGCPGGNLSWEGEAPANAWDSLGMIETSWVWARESVHGIFETLYLMMPVPRSTGSISNALSDFI